MGGPFGKYDLHFCFGALNFPKNRVATLLKKTESGFGIPLENNPPYVKLFNSYRDEKTNPSSGYFSL